VVCGFNDESVPGKIAPDPFLPDAVRETLGLTCQASRRARDAYLLMALAAQREKTGALHLVVGQTNDSGDVLRPSRLLFACADAALPPRIRHLFPKESHAPAVLQPAHHIPWRLAPWRIEKALASVNPTLLASYLRCPLRCALEKFFKMVPVEATQREMTPGDFGALVHEVLAAFGREEKLRDSVSEKEIAKFFDETLDHLAAQHWGARPLLSTALQVEAARQRLAHAARVQAGLRAQGWRIQEVELEIKADAGLMLAQVPFIGRVDRVDVHLQSGAVCIWDYKTRHKNVSPSDAHSSAVRKEDEEQAWKQFANAKGKPRVWTDLQLPLYVWALRNKYPEAPYLGAGYIHLPAAVTESAAQFWEELDDDLIASAHRCAEEVVRRMKDGIFWPPADEVSHDAFEDILLGDAKDSVLNSILWKGAEA
jgi:ATP-dependent helicase/nuclease subunit B